jgi:iron complex transport system permease protein
LKEATPAGAGPDPRRNRQRWFVIGVVVLLGVTTWASLSLGAVVLPPSEVLAVLAGKLGLDTGAFSTQAEAVVWGIRVPRAAMGLLVGGTLALIGGVLQGLLRNELADPHLLGLGPGAAIGAAIGSSAGGSMGGIAGGVAAGVLTALGVRRLAVAAGADPNRLILSGVALGAAFSAWVGFVVFASDRARVPPIEFWLLGSLAGSTWRALGTMAVFVILAVVVMLGAARTLDIVRLGDGDARGLGVDVDLVRSLLLTTAGAAVGATVGTVGVVTFVGLLVPWVVTRFTGHPSRPLLIGSILTGGWFVLASDLGARMLISPVEIPVGLITAALGGPLFLWLLTRSRHD